MSFSILWVPVLFSFWLSLVLEKNHFLNRENFIFGSFFHRFLSTETSLITVSLRYNRLWARAYGVRGHSPMATRKKKHTVRKVPEAGKLLKGFSCNPLSPLGPTSLQPFRINPLMRKMPSRCFSSQQQCSSGPGIPHLSLRGTHYITVQTITTYSQF